MRILRLLLSTWISALTVVKAQRNGRPSLYTHAENYLPLSSNLISAVPPVLNLSKIIPNISIVQIPGVDVPTSDRNPYQDPCRAPIYLKYRTADGSCNNQRTRGQAMRPLARLLPPAYSDGVKSPRNYSVVGQNQTLPSARVVSRAVHPDRRSTSNFTIFVMQYGQLMDHEMVSTPLPIEDTRGTVQCCGPEAGPPTGSESSECFAISFPPNDPNFRGTCMEFVRSQPIEDNTLAYRENQNIVTSFIDASVVYGSSQERQNELRDRKKKYLLRTTPGEFLPDNGINDCIKRNANDSCFLAGDERVNEQPGLTLMHIILVRYHNIIANALQRHQPNALHGDIFQKARAIVGAVMQNILYAEWIPIVLGPTVRRRYGLNFGKKRTKHDPNQDPRILTVFSTATFRFGHTLIPRSLPLSRWRRVLLRELFFKPFEAKDNLDTMTEGFLQAADSEERTQPPDQFIVEEVTGHLFENQEGGRNGFDLVALNIQRGRDHGIPSYNAFRQAVGLQKVTSFSDPALGTAGPSLGTVYSHVDDIDVFSGGMSEPPHDGGLVGETFSNLMGLQFKRLKYGDFFFFHNQKTQFGFTDTQVRLLRKVRLAHVLCLTTKVTSVQPNAFRIPTKWNRPKNCSDLQAEHLDLNQF